MALCLGAGAGGLELEGWGTNIFDMAGFSRLGTSKVDGRMGWNEADRVSSRGWLGG